MRYSIEKDVHDFSYQKQKKQQQARPRIAAEIDFAREKL